MTAAGSLALTVLGPAGEEVSSYRWIAEEDRTYDVVPGVKDPATLSVRFHASYMPVAATGDAAHPPASLDPTKPYFVSVLPDSGYSMGGARVAVGQEAVTIHVHKLPLPTAQITIFVYEDNAPINNAADLPGESGLAGFAIKLEDAGGRYGVSAGHQMQDAFGKPLGTTYNADGSVAMLGHGTILTDAEGRATIKYLAPGKYGVQVVPPGGSSWVQTSTIEGTKVIDAWVKPNEPGYFMEFGPPGYHVAVGFVKPMNDASVLTGGSTISGQVVNLHMSRPPEPFYNGAPLAHTTAWVGLNVGPVGAGRGVFAMKAGSDGTFSIPNVPPGDHQLVIWDEALDQIFAFKKISVKGDGSCATPSGTCALGDVPVFQWFTRLEHHVFNDKNANGFRDAGEEGIPEMAVNLRWRDGTLYQSYATDTAGFVPFDQVFPFFSWQVAEVDFTRLKATGVTVVVDDGGPADPASPWSFGGQLNPQPQAENNGQPYRTETGPVLTQAFQGFLGQTSVMQWGKKEYAPGENGGISGIVYYATTRAENDPRYAAAEPWEPGIPRVTVNLYDSTGTVLYATTTTDSWDDNPPTGCQAPPFAHAGQPTDCFDGLKNFNQVRPGVFDGGYAFTSYYPGGVGNGGEAVQGLPPGDYVVEVVPPTGYELVKEEDRNVDFGDSYTPSPLLVAAECVGPPHRVPDKFSLFALTDDAGNPVAPYRAGQDTPLCSRKRVLLQDRQNAAADFFLFTYVPVSGHIMGFVLDDAANEFDPNAPTFGEKHAPPWLPVSIRDWTGREISRTYTDEYGSYNALVPSTYTTNHPTPSGMGPNMVTTCVNSPTKPDPNNPGGQILDPFYNPQYSQFCYTFQYMPGATTYLDTPVVPVAAFAGPNKFPLDCELATGTPRVFAVNGPLGGPYVPVANGSQTLTIVAANATAGGKVAVPNPAHDGSNAATVLRDYGFGAAQGQVRLGGTSLPIASWTEGIVVATVPSGAVTGQLEVVRGDNQQTTVNAVTVTVGTDHPVAQVTPGQTIQQVIDAAQPGTLVLVPPGRYDELVVMWKPVLLQGYGEGTTINALKVPAEKLAGWRQRVNGLIGSGTVSLLPSQEIGTGGIEPVTLFSEEGPGIIVLAKDANPNRGGFGQVKGKPNARIDGFTITGGDSAGGILANAYAHYLEISNNRVVGNHGAFGGGIRIGHAALVRETNQGLVHEDAKNDHVAIHDNQISRNGALGGAGGGISLYAGSGDYRVLDNFVCGNYTQGEGAGIGHLGLSPGGLISRNTIVFNESFNQGLTVSGGGIAIVGSPPLSPGGLTPGAGSVRIISNKILGNSAGAGDGGGIRLSRINGDDVARNRNNSARWHAVDLLNNVVVNNVAALAAGGISLQDAAAVRIVHTVVANNDSTATAGDAFSPGSPNVSSPLPAGIVSRRHSPALAAALPASALAFSNPQLTNSIVWHNRSFYFLMDNVNADPPAFGLVPTASQPPVFDDLAVLGADGKLDPRSCILGSTAGYDASNLAADPLFLAEYFNRDRGETVAQPEITTALQTPPAFDEGGNFIRVGFGPLTLTATDTLELLGDYHIGPASPALGRGALLTAPDGVSLDIDGQPRPSPAGTLPDIGADEL